MAEWRTIKRDPFARHELQRRLVPKAQRRNDCKWCGGEGKYEYRIETDGGRAGGFPGRYCCVSCLHAYNE